MKVSKTLLGTVIETGKYLVFFGNRKAQLIPLQNRYPEFNFLKIKQTHSDCIVEASTALVEADSHWRQEKKQALVIATADCGPVMLVDAEHGVLCAVHAGWRGVQNEILKKSVLFLLARFPALKLQAFVGPHIQFSSFEVEDSIRDSLLKTVQSNTPEMKVSGYSRPSKSGFSLVDLNLIIRDQLISVGIQRENIFCLFEDTKTNANYHSYRRDQKSSGRQLSFIALK